MKAIFSLITLTVICCAQAQIGGGGYGRRDDGWRIGGLPVRPGFPHPILPQPIPTFPEPTIPPNTGYQNRRVWNIVDTTPSPSPQFPTDGPIAVDPVEIPVIGGIGNPTEITQEHRNLAAFAAGEIGSEYSLTEVKEVREQLVAGMLYRIKIVISKTKNLEQTTLECDVTVYHIIWLSQKTLEEFKCKRLANV